MSRSDHSDRSTQERVARLKKRLEALRPYPGDAPDPLVAIVRGILDLLEDEL